MYLYSALVLVHVTPPLSLPTQIESRLPVGTPEYIAPEVLTSLDKSADYGVCCDWWSLGIIAYELLYESTPFEDESTSKMYGNIMSYKVCRLHEDTVDHCLIKRSLFCCAYVYNMQDDMHNNLVKIINEKVS